MPYSSADAQDLPDWIYDMSENDECLFEVLADAWVAQKRARRAVNQRGDAVPKRCAEEYRSALEIMGKLERRDYPVLLRAKKASQALRKFVTARQCARYLETETSPVYARDRRSRTRARPTTRVRRR